MTALIAPPPDVSAQIAPAADAVLGGALAQGLALADRASAPDLAFALEDIEGLDLSSIDSARIDRAQLRALASIYLAADLEPAGIVATVEQLSRLSASGGLTIGLGGAGGLLEQWWRARNDRMSAEERGAFFARLFGTASGPIAADASRNGRFEDRMLELCEALATIDRDGGLHPHGGSANQARVRMAARALAQNLGDASSGLTAFVAGEVMATLKQAFAVLSHQDLRGAFAARDVWGVVRAINRLAHGRQVDPLPYVRRGKAGMLLLSWLADKLDAVLASGALAEPGDPVIGAAVDWLEATLSLGEEAATAPAAQAEPMPRRTAASDWSVLGS